MSLTRSMSTLCDVSTRWGGGVNKRPMYVWLCVCVCVCVCECECECVRADLNGLEPQLELLFLSPQQDEEPPPAQAPELVHTVLDLEDNVA